MKKIVSDRRLMIKACDLYYNKNKNHQQIAELLSISRPTVSRILASAVEEKIVTITVNRLDAVKYWDTERRLKERFGLDDAVIVDSDGNDAQLKRALGTAAGKYLESVVKDGDYVGVAMGSTLYHTAYAPVEPPAQNVTFLPLIGGMGQLQTELHSNHLAETLAKAYGGRFVPLYAPARVSGLSIRNQFVREQSVASVLQLQKNLSVALVGIGYPNRRSSIQETGYYKANEIRSLTERNVAGEICMQFYDVNGNTAPYKNDNNVIGLELSKLKKIPFSIGVAGGIDKLSAIRGAICGNYINVLITDLSCAEALLENQ